MRVVQFANAMMQISRQNGLTAVASATRAGSQMPRIAPLHVLRQHTSRRCLHRSVLRQMHGTVSCSAVGDDWTNGVCTSVHTQRSSNTLG